MKSSRLIIATVLGAALVHGPAFAQVDARKAEGLAKQAGCLNCHNADATKKVGPGYKDVAAKNKGATVDKLAADMKAKPVHQAALKAAKEEDVKTILGWILSL